MFHKKKAHCIILLTSFQDVWCFSLFEDKFISLVSTKFIVKYTIYKHQISFITYINHEICLGSAFYLVLHVNNIFFL